MAGSVITYWHYRPKCFLSGPRSTVSVVKSFVSCLIFHGFSSCTNDNQYLAVVFVSHFIVSISASSNKEEGDKILSNG